MTDTELLDFLEELHANNTYSSEVILRMSTMGRGWRLHSSRNKGELPLLGSGQTVREAIAAAIEEKSV